MLSVPNSAGDAGSIINVILKLEKSPQHRIDT